MVDEMVDRLLDILADKLTERLSAGHKELYTAKELAERYGVSCATIRNKMAAGEFGELVSVGERTRLVPWAAFHRLPSKRRKLFLRQQPLPAKSPTRITGRWQRMQRLPMRA